MMKFEARGKDATIPPAAAYQGPEMRNEREEIERLKKLENKLKLIRFLF
jgi:hypothetical protein